jgi:hypothetical protein
MIQNYQAFSAYIIYYNPYYNPGEIQWNTGVSGETGWDEGNGCDACYH